MNLLGNMALGYGADRLAGGKGGIGAGLGLLAGGTDYGMNFSGMMDGGNFLQSGSAGLFDSTTGFINPSQESVGFYKGSNGVSVPLNQAEMNAVQSGSPIGNLYSTTSGLPKQITGASNFNKALPIAQPKASGLFGMNPESLKGIGELGKVASGVGDMWSSYKQGQMSDEEIDMRRQAYANQLAMQQRGLAQQAQTQENIDKAFAKSSIPSYY